MCTTSELFAFEAQSVHTCREATHSVPAPSRHHDISTEFTYTPLQLQVFAQFLASHPNQAFVSRLIYSLTNGFDIGYIGPHHQLTVPNLPSAYPNTPQLLTRHLQKEIAEQRIAGPYPTPPYNNFHCSGIGVVPKKDRGWCLIYHLSAPAGHSINDY